MKAPSTPTSAFGSTKSLKSKDFIKQYDSVTTEIRFKLIQSVIKNKVGIKEASEQLGLKYQTAKSIVRRFRLTGKIERQYRILKNLNNNIDDIMSIDNEEESKQEEKITSLENKQIQTDLVEQESSAQAIYCDSKDRNQINQSKESLKLPTISDCSILRESIVEDEIEINFDFIYYKDAIELKHMQRLRKRRFIY